MAGTVLQGVRLFAEGQMKDKEKKISGAGGEKDAKINSKEDR